MGCNFDPLSIVSPGLLLKTRTGSSPRYLSPFLGGPSYCMSLSWRPLQSGHCIELRFQGPPALFPQLPPDQSDRGADRDPYSTNNAVTNATNPWFECVSLASWFPIESDDSKTCCAGKSTHVICSYSHNLGLSLMIWVSISLILSRFTTLSYWAVLQ